MYLAEIDFDLTIIALLNHFLYNCFIVYLLYWSYNYLQGRSSLYFIADLRLLEVIMDYNYLSPYIRVAMDSIINPPWTLSERVIFDYELLYIKEGSVIITVEDSEYTGEMGDIFLFKPKQRHSIRTVGNKRFRQPHLHFDLFYCADSPDTKVSFKALDKMSMDELKYFREDVTTDGLMDLPNKISLKNVDYFESMLFEIIKEYKDKTPFYEILVKGLFLKMWAYLLREYKFISNPGVFNYIDELEGVKEFLKTNLDKEITLDILEKEFKISKYHLSRTFKKVFGTTPIHYSQLLRLEKAKELIQYSNMNLTGISEILGFKSINAFSRAFRNIEGVSPSYYRRR